MVHRGRSRGLCHRIQAHRPRQERNERAAFQSGVFMSSLVVDLLLVQTHAKDRLVDMVSFALDYMGPKESVATDPAVPAEISRLRACLVTSPLRGWSTLLLSPLLREDELTERLARLLSKRLGGACLHVVVSDGVLLYELYGQGELVHSYCSSDALPDFHHNPEPLHQGEELLEVAGVPDPSGATARKLSQSLAGPLDGWGEGLFHELSKALKIPELTFLRFEDSWEDGLVDEFIGETSRASFTWGAQEITYLEVESPLESEVPSEGWRH